MSNVLCADSAAWEKITRPISGSLRFRESIGLQNLHPRKHKWRRNAQGNTWCIWLSYSYDTSSI